MLANAELLDKSHGALQPNDKTSLNSGTIRYETITESRNITWNCKRRILNHTLKKVRGRAPPSCHWKEVRLAKATEPTKYSYVNSIQ